YFAAVVPVSRPASGFQFLQQLIGLLAGHAVNRQLRVGTNAGGEYRTVEYVEVVEVVVFAIAVDHAAGGVFAHGQPAHAVSGAGGKGIGTEFQRVNAGFGFFPAGKPGRIHVRDPHRFGTGGKLDFRHAQPGAAHAIPQVIVDDVVDNRRAIAGQFNAAA